MRLTFLNGCLSVFGDLDFSRFWISPVKIVDCFPHGGKCTSFVILEQELPENLPHIQSTFYCARLTKHFENFFHDGSSTITISHFYA